ncbi:MAG: AIPR family protein [Chloroflexi bacterium]|nr:AIPR family protein [Chloroflexota bacterium]
MPANDLIALNAKLQEAHRERAPDLDEGEFFELFVAEQALKDFYPTDEEVEAGQVGGGNDGGLDGLYFSVNRQFVADDTDIDPKTVTRADLILIQATRETSFNETRVEKLNLLTEDLLDLSRGEGQLLGTYNADVVSAMTRFKDKYKGYLHVTHDFAISYHYICKGDTAVINLALRKQSERVTAKAQELFSQATVSFRFVGASELLDLINKHPQKAYALTMAEAPISPREQQAWVCLVPIAEYYKFIVDEDGEIRNELFEANVRDWMGNNAVNEAIRKSLEDSSSQEDFWWLNNGITILAAKANAQGGHILSVETPQIVNGLQTSRSIFNYVRALKDTSSERRNVLIRVITTRRAESPDHIIKATNSQTEVPPYRLHMTEKIHRDIETLLRNYSLFYDRRKNFYKNESKPIAKIVQPLNLAQTIMSVVLQKPDDARARPTTVLKNEYERVFSENYPLPLYATCALFMKKIDRFLVTRESGATRNDRTNQRWYLAMEYARALTGKTAPSVIEVSSMKIPNDDTVMLDSYSRVRDAFQALGGTDKVAKGSDLVKKLKALRV